MAPNPSTDGKDSPRAVYDDVVDSNLAMRREAMIWREDAGKKFRVPLLPTKLADVKLQHDIPIEGKWCFISFYSYNVYLLSF